MSRSACLLPAQLWLEDNNLGEEGEAAIREAVRGKEGFDTSTASEKKALSFGSVSLLLDSDLLDSTDLLVSVGSGRPVRRFANQP